MKFDFEILLEADKTSYVEFSATLEGEVYNIWYFADEYTMENTFNQLSDEHKEEIKKACHGHLEMQRQLGNVAAYEARYNL